MNEAPNQDRWTLLTFAVPLGSGEIVAEWLWELETAGYEEKESPRELRIEAYFPASRKPESLLDQVAEKAGQAGLKLSRLRAETCRFDAQAWVEKCRRNYRGFAVGETFYLHPPWEAPDSHYPVRLVLEPSQAFGTGTHESTQLCLSALVALAPRCRTMLDAGTGNGVLSLAALKLHPTIRVTALDNDPTAVEVACETLARNGIPPGTVRLMCGEPAAIAGRFDLVAANLTLAIFRQTASDLIRAGACRLLLSGFTSDQRPLVAELFQHEFEVEQADELNGWASLTLRKRETGDGRREEQRGRNRRGRREGTQRAAEKNLEAEFPLPVSGLRFPLLH